ncbi:MAG: substrate-binding domain-containing protein [Rhodanobacteraceae bacterium]
MSHDRLIKLLAVFVLAAGTSAAIAAPPGAAETVTVFSAGSLRGVVGELGAQVEKAYGIRVVPTFGGSGALRDRIEHGAPADLLLSADLGSPRKLQQAGRTAVPALAFARNRMCIVSPRSAGVTPDNLVEKMLVPTTRVWTSTPVVDPGGDYAAAIFDRIDALHPDTGAALKSRAEAVRAATAKAPGSGLAKFAALFAGHKIDMMVTYCSGASTLTQQAPQLASIEVPPSLDPHPVDGMAVLSDRPAVLRVALYLLSEAGQAIVAQNGLVPVARP